MPAADKEIPRDWSWIAAVMLMVTAAISATAAAAALGGAEALEANVREIEVRTGATLYASLGSWGLALALAAIVEAAGAIVIWRGAPHRILAAQAAAYLGLVISFFTLVILRLPGVVPIVLLFSAIYVLSYRSGPRPREF